MKADSGWGALALAFLWLAPPREVAAQRFAYLDEDSYLADLAALGLVAVSERFEHDAAWAVR